MGEFWQDLRHLVREPLFLEAALAVVLFVAVLLVFRRMRRIAAELERRRALSEYVRGLDEFLRGDFRVARDTLEQVLVRDPENVEARIALGDCYRELGDAAEAKRHHHHVHKVFGHELARNFLSLGLDELALKNHERSIEAFQRALELQPGDGDALSGLARANAEAGHAEAAAEALRRLYPKGPEPEMARGARREAARRFSEAGAAALEGDDAERAVRFFTEALAFQRESIRARTGLLRAAHHLGDRNRARELVARHMEELRAMSRESEVLFEPAPPHPRIAAPAEGVRRLAAGEARRGGDGETSLLPARVRDLGTVVASVEAKTARYQCLRCGRLLRSYAEVCPACSQVGTVEELPELRQLYAMPLKDFRAAVDEVEENAAFVEGLAQRASTGDRDALQALLERGKSVLPELFAALPGVEARGYLGQEMAALGAGVANEVRLCHAGRGGGGLGYEARAHDEFAAAFYLALPGKEHDAYLTSLGEARDAAVAGVLVDRRLRQGVRDAALNDLQRRGRRVLPAVLEVLAASRDLESIELGGRLVAELGNEAADELEKRYLSGGLLGRLRTPAGGPVRRVVADVLARSGLPRGAEILGRAAARERDPALRAHFLAARERAEREASS